MKNKILAASAATVLVLTLSACEDNPTAESEALKAVNADAANRKVYTPTNDVEWCTLSEGMASIP